MKSFIVLFFSVFSFEAQAVTIRCPSGNEFGLSTTGYRMQANSENVLKGWEMVRSTIGDRYVALELAQLYVREVGNQQLRASCDYRALNVQGLWSVAQTFAGNIRSCRPVSDDCRNNWSQTANSVNCYGKGDRYAEYEVSCD